MNQILGKVWFPLRWFPPSVGSPLHWFPLPVGLYTNSSSRWTSSHKQNVTKNIYVTAVSLQIVLFDVHRGKAQITTVTSII